MEAKGWRGWRTWLARYNISVRSWGENKSSHKEFEDGGHVDEEGCNGKGREVL